MKSEHKLPLITISFWVMKIIATTLGETLGDHISMTLNLGYLVSLIVTFAFFLIVLVNQLIAKKYVPVFFWVVIIATTTVGTEISDFIDRSLHLGYAWGSLLLFSLLVITLLLWFKNYKSLSLESITGGTKEIYFWMAVLFSNSLGTAFGDYLSDNLSLSYLYGAMITAAVMLIVVLLHYFTKINRIVLFWVAFIFTRPFGATFGDFLTKPVAKGGLDLGTLAATLVSLFLMGLFIFQSHRKQRQELQNKSI
ncbi:MAG: hypothetical protein ABIP79_08790 [Chitinophagaceae bacterium]